VTAIGSGTIQRSPNQTLNPYGSTVRLTPVPSTAANYFRFWGGAAPNQFVSPLNFIVTNANPSVSGSFGNLPANTHSLTVFINGDGNVTKAPQNISCEG